MAPGINSFLTSYANGVTPAPVIGGKNSESANKIGEIGKVIWNTVVGAFNTGVRGDSASPKVNFISKDQTVPEKGSGGKKVAKLYKNKRDEVGALFEDGIEDTREGEVEINFDLLPRAVSEEDEDEEEWDEDEVFEYRPNYTPEAIDRICASKEFALNSENFIISYTGEFLKSYARDYRNTSTFKNHGILASLALTHLNDPTITCGINTAHRCAPTCADVVRKLQSNLDTARSVYFAFQSAQHLAETMKSLNSGLFAAQVNVANLAAEMAGSFFWTEPPPEKREKWLKYALGMAELVIGQVAGAIPQIATSTLVEGLLHSEIDKSKAHIEKWTGELALFTQSMRANIEKGALKAAKAEKLKINGLENGIRAVEQKTELLLKTATAIGRSGGFTGRGREEWAAMGTMTLLSFWKTSIEQKFFANAHDGEKSQSTNENMLQAFVSGTTDATRQGLVRFADKVFGGGEVAEDGSTHFTNLIYSGQFLPGHKASRVGYYHSPEMEEKIKRAVMLKAFNQALRSQTIYITCTPKFRKTRRPHRPTSEDTKNYLTAPSCSSDNTGPQDFKACIDNEVCYMYRWSDRGTQLDWHNERPYGKEVWSEAPWEIDIADIIKSSVLGAKANSTSTPNSDLLDPTKFAKSLDPATPGLFTIPVCFSAHPWSTVVDGHTRPNKWMHNVDMLNSIKALPCNCGPWGRDTEKVWREIGIWKDSKPKKFAAMTCINCGWQIRDKIRDKLERYVAFCRIDTHAIPNGRIRWKGKQPDCDTVTKLLDESGMPPEELKVKRPETYRALTCWARLERQTKRKSGCERYMNLDLGGLLRLAEEEDRGRVIGGAKGKSLAVGVGGNGMTMEEHWRELEVWDAERRKFEEGGN